MEQDNLNSKSKQVHVRLEFSESQMDMPNASFQTNLVL